MLQMPKIEVAMDSLCRQLAKCDLDHSSQSICIMFSQKLQEASANQMAQGSTATWHRIPCHDEEQVEV
jgi:hypothetical protein